MYIYINNKFLWEWLGANPMTWYKKKMLSKDSMPNVNESVNENNSSGENPITSDELNEDEVKHDPFEFPHDEEIPFSRLLYDMIVWHV